MSNIKATLLKAISELATDAIFQAKEGDPEGAAALMKDIQEAEAFLNAPTLEEMIVSIQARTGMCAVVDYLGDWFCDYGGSGEEDLGLFKTPTEAVRATYDHIGGDVAPDWDSAPDWAKFWAVDLTGMSYFYGNEPEFLEEFGIWWDKFQDKPGMEDQTVSTGLFHQAKHSLRKRPQ